MRRAPKCCGSEDGELFYGTDLVRDADIMVEVWACRTCGTVTVTDLIQTSK